jgi:hypothetical protein
MPAILENVSFYYLRSLQIRIRTLGASAMSSSEHMNEQLTSGKIKTGGQRGSSARFWISPAVAFRDASSARSTDMV